MEPTAPSTVACRRPPSGGSISLIAVVAAATLVAACSGGGSSKTAFPGAGGTTRTSTGGSIGFTTPSTAPPGVATSLATRPSKLKLRFFNGFALNGKPGPAIDIYDNLLQSDTVTSLPKGAKPVVAGLKYGGFSDYLTPGALNEPGSNGETHFTALVSGQKPGPSNPLVSAGGVLEGTSPPQETEALFDRQSTGSVSGSDSGSSDSGVSSTGLTGMTYQALAEKKGGQQGVPPSTAPSDKAVFALSTSSIPKPKNSNGESGNGGGTFFFVDHSCDPPANADDTSEAVPDIFVSGAASSKLGPYPFFEATAGKHDLAITFWAENTTPTCDQVKPSAPQSTATVEAGKVYMTVPYGVDAEHIKIAAGAIAQ